MPDPSPDLVARATRVRLLLCDVDGILTDASIYVGDPGEYKRFNVRDGLGIAVWRRQGFKTGWVSARPSAATTIRAQELGVEFLIQQKGSKVAAIEGVLAVEKLTWDEVCYMGDDIVDLGALARAGLAVCVPPGHPEALKRAHYVTQLAGGQGAVREVIELILTAQGRWARVVEEALA
ncbi:MAG: HAD hydrolase family protein [Verrucomicrobiales bacterium]|nr:HAD hydrolase family protein [Verrucomicrobiales bacterium]